MAFCIARKELGFFLIIIAIVAQCNVIFKVLRDRFLKFGVTFIRG